MKSRKEVIKSAAARLFRKRGFQATSMRDIAEAVGIKASSIYNHIVSKQAILGELLLDIAHLFATEMQEIQTAALSPQQQLERLIALHVRLTVQHTDAIALIAAEWVHLEEPLKTEYLALREGYENGFKQIIEAGKTEGVFKNLDTEIILFATLSSLRWLYSWYSRNKNYNAVELERQMTDILIGGVLK
jgi:TetR/AcrR family transcriptional regulator, cholesterol catabolism regulator